MLISFSVCIAMILKVDKEEPSCRAFSRALRKMFALILNEIFNGVSRIMD